MGVTIHYRGQMADLDRVEEFEDRVLDMALEISAPVQVWRSAADHDPTRMVRGLLLDLTPGQETTSLLLSPEGWLIPLTEIQAAEQAQLTEPPLCCVKTQFGSVEGHIAMVELLSFMRHEYFPDLEVRDEGGYWESRDSSTLIRKRAEMRAGIESLGNGLRQWGLSHEAAEAPEILAHRIERVARQVQRTLRQAPEHPPVEWDEEFAGWESGGGVGNESQWDAFYKEQRRKQERLHRAIQEQVQQGMEHSEAFKKALREEGLLDPSHDNKSWDEETSEFDALIPLCVAGLLNEQDVEELRSTLAELSTGIADEVARIRERI